MNKVTHGHETSDAPVLPIAWAGLVLAIVVVFVGGIVYAMFRYLEPNPAETQPNPLRSVEERFPPAPRVETHPDTEWQELLNKQEKQLSTYGWVDRDKGIVHIPISRAMELQLQQGLPTRKEKPKQ